MQIATLHLVQLSHLACVVTVVILLLLYQIRSADEGRVK